MFNETHHLVDEFPEFKDFIPALKINNKHFNKMFQDYEALDQEIHSIEQGVRGVSDEYSENLKKNRANLKDKLYAVLKQNQSIITY